MSSLSAYLVPAQFFLGPALLAAAALWLMTRNGWPGRFTDIPNERSLHAQPVPRIGGLAIGLAVACGTLVMMGLSTADAAGRSPLREIFLCAIPLFVVSVIDDRRSLPAGQRILVHLAAAVLFTLVMLWHVRLLWAQPGQGASWLVSIVVASGVVVVVVWGTNLFNFMDGADGLAGGMAAIGFGTYAMAAFNTPTGAWFGLACLVLSGAAVGFLAFNFPPARVFLGDAGSVPLGFLAAALAVYGSVAGHWPWWFGLMVFSPFIVDASYTLAKRVLHGEKFWLPHRQHFYQRLILGGWSHRATVLAYYFLMLASAVCALLAQNPGVRKPIAIGWVITYALLVLLLEWRLGNNNKNNKDKNHTGST